jgi:hypothetical protein
MKTECLNVIADESAGAAFGLNVALAIESLFAFQRMKVGILALPVRVSSPAVGIIVPHPNVETLKDLGSQFVSRTQALGIKLI